MKPCPSGIHHKFLGTARDGPADCTLQLRMRTQESILRDYLPPQSRIVLPFVDPPDVLCAVGRLADEIPAGIKESAAPTVYTLPQPGHTFSITPNQAADCILALNAAALNVASIDSPLFQAPY